MNSPDSIIAAQERESTLHGLVRLLRPRQWVKNGFVLAPLMFSGKFLDPSAVAHAFLAVLLFCVGSSATYIVNDIHDMERDRQHPLKAKQRPLASGAIKVPQALVLLSFLYFLLIGGYFLLPEVVLVILVYMALNIAYTFVLKHQPVIDIFTIALGFVLRIYAGAKAFNIGTSSWMLITTLCLALYLASVKRRQELLMSGEAGRKVLEHYNIALVERYAEMSATGAVVFYSLFVMSVRPELVMTIPVVIYGLFRYWYIVESLEGGESPTDALLSDWQLLLTVVMWAGACLWALWPVGA